METALSTVDLDLSGMALAFDHDGNVHTKDIGQDYLLDVLPFQDIDAFVDAVYDLRNHRTVPSDAYVNGEAYSDGEELGIFLADNNISREDVTGNAYGDGFRDGFPAFLNDLVREDLPAFIVSAGDEDFLREFYANHDEVAVDVPIAGTRQSWQQNGDGSYAAGIAKGCGREKKPVRYQELAEAYGCTDHRLIASGDSPGDAELLDYARSTGGLAIATGPRAADHADVVVEGEDWYGQIAATLAYAGLVNGQDPAYIAEEAADYIGRVAEKDSLHVTVYAGDVDEPRSLNDQYRDICVGEAVEDIVEEIEHAYDRS